MTPRTLLLTATALVCFAGNSLLCRVALRGGRIDAASFTALRLVSGALVLLLILLWRGRGQHGNVGSGVRPSGNWGSAIALFAYAAPFSFAYVSLPAGTGALLLFGAVQVTMIAAGLRGGERPRPLQWFGLFLALAGLVGLVAPGLVAPGLGAPPLAGALLMILAGASWGIYSLRGRGTPDPTAATAGNFLRAAPLALALGALFVGSLRIDPRGAGYAIVSGTVTSGMGYVIWYAALQGLGAVGAASVQLATPVLAALGGILLLGEPLTVRLLLATPAVLGGIALVLVTRGARRSPPPHLIPEVESR